MTHYFEDTLPLELMALLKRQSTTALIATLNPDGYPRVIPVNLVTALDRQTLRLALFRHQKTIANIRICPRIILAFIDEGDISLSVKGEAHILREQMEAAKDLALVEVKVLGVKNDRSPWLLVNQGIRTCYRRGVMLLFFKNIFKEMREYPNLAAQGSQVLPLDRLEAEP